MIITLRSNVTVEEIGGIQRQLKERSWSTTRVTTQSGDYLVAIGSKELDLRLVGFLPGVKDVHHVSDVYKLVSSQWRVGATVVDLGDGVTVGGGGHTLMAGPCSIEDETQVRSVVEFLASSGIRVMRGGVFKPRSSPYSFRGLGLEGLKMWSSIARARGIKIVTEVLDASQIASMDEYVDMYQVGARNSQNFTLLDELGKVDKPVLLKRGMSGTLEELLQSAEYIFSNGNEKILLCERGIRTYDDYMRNTLDLAAVPMLKELTHLPVIVDPSHGTGHTYLVPAMAAASVAAGCDGLIVEVHPSPETASSDGYQSLNFAQFQQMMTDCRKIAEAIGRSLG